MGKKKKIPLTELLKTLKFDVRSLSMSRDLLTGDIELYICQHPSEEGLQVLIGNFKNPKSIRKSVYPLMLKASTKLALMGLIHKFKIGGCFEITSSPYTYTECRSFNVEILTEKGRVYFNGDLKKVKGGLIDFIKDNIKIVDK